MPRKAKDEIELNEEKKVKKASNTKKDTNKKDATPTKKTTKKRGTKETVAKNTPSKKSAKEVTTKATKKETKKSTSSKATTTKKVNTKKAVTTKKASTKVSIEKDTITNKTSTTKDKKVSATKKTSATKSSNKTKKTSSKKIEVIEYYDLPYRYNQTVVKALAQTPTTLFVYWDISDDDRKKYIKQYGEYFFNNTKPVLIIHNKTKNYSYEVEINDFANSWYLHSMDSDCDYQIELGRRPINEYVNIANNYLYITTSNEIESPNDHILFEKLSHFVYFKNVKTNQTIKKNLNLTLLSKIGKISSVQEFYKKLYPEEAIDFDRLDLKNPSSANPTSSFK